MQQIEIDFDVFKALTLRRENESHTYNDVLRSLLGLPESVTRQISKKLSIDIGSFGHASPGGFNSRGIFLPNGTNLRATYKGENFSASIQESRWIGADGEEFSSPSAAASAITGTNVNGLRFWEAKRPSDTEWRKLDALPKAWDL